jgi:DNA-directed RNA polymerase subunit K/omega
MFESNEQDYEETEYIENEQGENEIEEDDELDDSIIDRSDDEEDIESIENEEMEENEVFENKEMNHAFIGGGEEEEDSDEETSDEEEDDEYDYKLDNDYKMKYIQTIHPEETSHEYEEIRNLTHVSRDENNNIIKDEKHQTVPILTKYEKTRILGLRVSQLNKGAKAFVKTTNAIIDNNIIAQQELKEKKLPFIIMRPIPNGKREYWKLEDLEYIEN